MFLFRGVAAIGLSIFGFFLGIFMLFTNTVQGIIKLKNGFGVLVKIKNILLKLLNLGAGGYGLFVSAEPLIARFTASEEEDLS